MNKQALACPFCRTWFEGSGHSVKCPACGRRFDASTALLAATSHEPSHYVGAALPHAESTSPGHDELAMVDDGSVAGDALTETAADRETLPVNASPDLRTWFTVMFLALVFVGPRFLEGPAILVIVVAPFLARWLYGRWQSAGRAV